MHTRPDDVGAIAFDSLRSQTRKVGSMKKYLWLPLLLIAVIGSAALTTKAQSTNGLRANVPFEFNVGDETLQAGKISVREIGMPSSGAFAVSNLDTGQHAIRLAHAATGSKENDRAKLVFRRYGNRYYLAQVWVPGYNAQAFGKSKSERSLERDTMLSKNSTTELVTILADLQ